MINVNINPAVANEIRDEFMDIMIQHNANRAEAIAACLAILGLEYKGDILDEFELRSFITECSDYFLCYFTKQAVAH